MVEEIVEVHDFCVEVQVESCTVKNIPKRSILDQTNSNDGHRL